MSMEALEWYFRSLRLAREARLSSPELSSAYASIKTFQTRRFEAEYADLLLDTHFRPPLRFFLAELYGPNDFADRDEQFERISPAVERLFPPEVLETVERLVELHSLSEALDVAMGKACVAMDLRVVDPQGYQAAWCKVDCRQERRRQLELVIRLGSDLSILTRRRGLRRMLGLMRLPAKLAGMEQLQSFLERGFDTFASVREPEAMLSMIQDRESRFIATMNAAS